MARRRAVLRVTHEAIIEMLGLPPDVRLFAVVQRPGERINGTALLVIEHPAFPEVLEEAEPRVYDVAQCLKMIEEKGE